MVIGHSRAIPYRTEVIMGELSDQDMLEVMGPREDMELPDEPLPDDDFDGFLWDQGGD